MWRLQGGRDLDSWRNCKETGAKEYKAPEEADKVKRVILGRDMAERPLHS